MKRYRALLLSLVTMQAAAICDTAATVEQAIKGLNQYIVEHALTDNDKAMIQTIINNRLEGRMLKIVPNFSESGNAVYAYIIEQSECLGGFDSLKGVAYGVDVLQLLAD